MTVGVYSDIWSRLRNILSLCKILHCLYLVLDSLILWVYILYKKPNVLYYWSINDLTPLNEAHCCCSAKLVPKMLEAHINNFNCSFHHCLNRRGRKKHRNKPEQTMREKKNTLNNLNIKKLINTASRWSYVFHVLTEFFNMLKPQHSNHVLYLLYSR